MPITVPVEETQPQNQVVVTTAVEKAEAPAVEAPAVEAPAVEAPAVEDPAVEDPAVEAPAVEATTQDWSVFDFMGEAVTSADDVKTRWTNLIAERDQVVDSLSEMKKTHIVAANPMVASLNGLYEAGATDDDVNSFLRIRSIGGVDKASDIELMAMDMVSKGTAPDMPSAKAWLNREYKTDVKWLDTNFQNLDADDPEDADSIVLRDQHLAMNKMTLKQNAQSVRQSMKKIESGLVFSDPKAKQEQLDSVNRARESWDIFTPKAKAAMEIFAEAKVGEYNGKIKLSPQQQESALAAYSANVNSLIQSGMPANQANFEQAVKIAQTFTLAQNPNELLNTIARDMSAQAGKSQAGFESFFGVKPTGDPKPSVVQKKNGGVHQVLQNQRPKSTKSTIPSYS